MMIANNLCHNEHDDYLWTLEPHNDSKKRTGKWWWSIKFTNSGKARYDGWKRKKDYRESKKEIVMHRLYFASENDPDQGWYRRV